MKRYQLGRVQAEEHTCLCDKVTFPLRDAEKLGRIWEVDTERGTRGTRGRRLRTNYAPVRAGTARDLCSADPRQERRRPSVCPAGPSLGPHAGVTVLHPDKSERTSPTCCRTLSHVREETLEKKKASGCTKVTLKIKPFPSQMQSECASFA